MGEVRGLADKYRGRGIEMGVGSSPKQYFTTRYQAELVLRGNPYLLDVVAVMFMQKSGQPFPEGDAELHCAGEMPAVAGAAGGGAF